jgi:hypothetical protein
MQTNYLILECIFRDNLDLICGLSNLEFLNNRFEIYLNKKWFGTSPKTSVRRAHILPLIQVRMIELNIKKLFFLILSSLRGFNP